LFVFPKRVTKTKPTNKRPYTETLKKKKKLYKGKTKVQSPPPPTIKGFQTKQPKQTQTKSQKTTKRKNPPNKPPPIVWTNPTKGQGLPQKPKVGGHPIVPTKTSKKKMQGKKGPPTQRIKGGGVVFQKTKQKKNVKFVFRTTEKT